MLHRSQQGTSRAAAKLAFRGDAAFGFRELARSLSAEGIKSEVRSDDLPGTPELLAFEDNKGTTSRYSRNGAI